MWIRIPDVELYPYPEEPIRVHCTGTLFLITQFLITKFLITKFLISKFLITKFLKLQGSGTMVVSGHAVADELLVRKI